MIGILLIVPSFAAAYVGNAEIWDGDTIRIKPNRFRLHGVDAPELSERGGHEAAFMLRRLIGQDAVECIPTGAKSFDRIVARCRTRKYPDLGAELIRRGVALDCRRYSHGEYAALETTEARRRLTGKPYCR